MSLVRTTVVQKVFCTLSIEGTHNWPNCHIPEVDYLKYPHRHLFGIKAVAEVNHDDRNIEFIELKHQIQNYMKEQYFDNAKQLHVFGHKSCEMLAKELMERFNLCEVVVDEDGENGSILTKIIEVV